MENYVHHGILLILQIFFKYVRKGNFKVEEFNNEEMYNNPPSSEITDAQETEIQEENITKKKFDWKKELMDWVISIIIAVVVALVIKTYIFTLVKVDGPSMNPTLSHGDTLYANRFMYSPEAGDIVIFRPTHSPKTPYIKRVIATEGQEVVIDAISGTVTVDGKVLEEDYIAEPLLSAGNMTYPCVVPEDHIFVLGDNRNNSRDSRDATVGFVPEDSIIGKAVFRILPLKEFGSLY